MKFPSNSSGIFVNSPWSLTDFFKASCLFLLFDFRLGYLKGSEAPSSTSPYAHSCSVLWCYSCCTISFPISKNKSRYFRIPSNLWSIKHSQCKSANLWIRRIPWANISHRANRFNCFYCYNTLIWIHLFWWWWSDGFFFSSHLTIWRNQTL